MVENELDKNNENFDEDSSQTLKDEKKPWHCYIKDFEFNNDRTKTQEILNKFLNHPASLNFHIYETHYKFNIYNDFNVIPKNSPMIKNFLNHVLREEIPFEMVELLNDFSITMYEGCIILEVHDHRNSNSNSELNQNNKEEIFLKQQETEEQQEDQYKDSTLKNQSNKQILNVKVYRTLLRPTQISIYHDLLCYTDLYKNNLTDNLSLELESKILILTHNNLNLSVYLLSYFVEEYLKSYHNKPKLLWNDERKRYNLKFWHRKVQDKPIEEEERCSNKNQESSDYEEIMFLFSDKQKNELKSFYYDTHDLKDNPNKNLNNLSKNNGIDLFLNNKCNPRPKDLIISDQLTQSIHNNPNKFMKLRVKDEIQKRKLFLLKQRNLKLYNYKNEGLTFEQAKNDVLKNGIVLKNDIKKKVKKKVNLKSNISNLEKPVDQFSHDIEFSKNYESKEFVNKLDNKEVEKNIMYQNQIQLKNQIDSSDLLVQNKNYPMQNFGPNNANKPQNFPIQLLNKEQTSYNYNDNNFNPKKPTEIYQNRKNPLNNSKSQKSSSKINLQNQISQRQIFISTLTTEEQNFFKHTQQKINTYLMINKTGMAPNGQCFDESQKHQALKQANSLQQMLIHRFPLYFKRIKQLHLFMQSNKHNN